MTTERKPSLILVTEAAVLTIVFNALIKGFVISVLWGWFIAPLGVTDINVAQAIGISMVVNFLTMNIAKEETKSDIKTLKDMMIRSISMTLFIAVVVLGMASIVQLFV